MRRCPAPTWSCRCPAPRQHVRLATCRPARPQPVDRFGLQIGGGQQLGTAKLAAASAGAGRFGFSAAMRCTIASSRPARSSRLRRLHSSACVTSSCRPSCRKRTRVRSTPSSPRTACEPSGQMRVRVRVITGHENMKHQVFQLIGASPWCRRRETNKRPNTLICKAISRPVFSMYSQSYSLKAIAVLPSSASSARLLYRTQCGHRLLPQSGAGSVGVRSSRSTTLGRVQHFTLLCAARQVPRGRRLRLRAQARARQGARTDLKARDNIRHGLEKLISCATNPGVQAGEGVTPRPSHLDRTTPQMGTDPRRLAPCGGRRLDCVP